MRKYLIIAAVLVPLYFLFMHAFSMSEFWRPRAIHVELALQQAYIEKSVNDVLTNCDPRDCRIFEFTNRYVIVGSNYQCVLAADSWDYQGASNLLALTTNKAFLYIDTQGAVPVKGRPPGY